jgi:type IV secretory pathway VirB10-like protein
LKINQSFEILEGIVRPRFAFLSRFAVKFVEVAGAGLASAACAYVFGQIERPQPPAAPVVQMVPASVERARMTQNDYPLLGETARKETDRPESAAAVPTPVAAPKLARSTQAASPRRNQKSEQGPLAETKARSGEPLALSSSRVASNAEPHAAPNAPGQSFQAPVGYEGSAASNSGEEEQPLLARLKQIPSWFLPENDRIFGELPRPPMPVGEFLQSSM